MTSSFNTFSKIKELLKEMNIIEKQRISNKENEYILTVVDVLTQLEINDKRP